jgi:hypothetical protein
LKKSDKSPDYRAYNELDQNGFVDVLDIYNTKITFVSGNLAKVPFKSMQNLLEYVKPQVIFMGARQNMDNGEVDLNPQYFTEENESIQGTEGKYEYLNMDGYASQSLNTGKN